jgi:outer membrane receptor protein involved in Fe transport
MADFFNLFNQNAITSVNANTGAAFGNALDILGPRVFRIGAKYNF